MGKQADSTVDHAIAWRSFGEIDPRDIISVEIVKGSDAVARFGPGAHQGAVLITTKWGKPKGK